MQKEPLMFDFISSSSFHSIYCDFLLPHQLAHSLNGTFIDPTKFLCFPVSKIHRKMELYVLQEFAIWLLLLINIHLFYKTVKKCLFSVGTAADTEQGYAPI